MRRHSILVPLAALACAVTLSIPPTSGAVTGAIAGDRAELDERPGWVNSGTFALDGQSLLFVDALNSAIVQHSLDGRRLGIVPNRAGKDGFPHPSMIQRAGATAYYWVENEDGDFHLLDRDFHPQKKERRNLLALLEAPNDLTSVYGWVPISPKELLVVGDLRRPTGAVTAFLRIPLDEPANFAVLREIPLDDPARRFLLLGNQYLAAVDGVPYFLVMGKAPYIQLPEGRELRLARVTPGGGRRLLSRPDLPERPGIAAIKESFARVENSSLPVGLFGWNHYLYVVMRDPADGDRTLWSLVKIDPREEKVLWTRSIKTSARHVTVIPGPRAWAFLEKEAVEGAGRQQIPSFFVVHSNQL